MFFFSLDSVDDFTPLGTHLSIHLIKWSSYALICVAYINDPHSLRLVALCGVCMLCKLSVICVFSPCPMLKLPLGVTVSIVQGVPRLSPLSNVVIH